MLFFEHKMLYATKGEVPEDPDFCVPFGQAAVRRAGKDVTLIAIGGMLPKALEAAELLAREGSRSRSSIPGRWCRWTKTPS